MSGTMDKHRCTSDNAGKFWEWISKRGGVAIWNSADLSDPTASWSTPVNAEDGTPKAKPTWKAESTPSRIITDPSEILVDTPKEVQRFHIAIKRGNSMNLTLTNASDRKVKEACRKAGPDSWYEFNYSSQEAVILIPGESTSLLEWAQRNHLTGLKHIPFRTVTDGLCIEFQCGLVVRNTERDRLTMEDSTPCPQCHLDR